MVLMISYTWEETRESVRISKVEKQALVMFDVTR